MLKQLSIRNYAIIKETQINFTNGLNIITGETGAGKSILIGALGLLLGNRADTKAVLYGEEKCVIEGKFLIKNYSLNEFFEKNELDYEDLAIIRRELTQNGKSRAFINDTPVSLQLLKELGTNLVDIVSQHQTLELNEAAFQLNMVDAIADNKKIFEDYKICFENWQKIKKHLIAITEQEAKARQDEDYIKFVLKEFEEVALKPNEQQELENNLQTLSHAEQIQQVASLSAHSINDSEQAVVDVLADIKNNLSSAAKYHQTFAELAKRIESNLIDLKDIAYELNQIATETQANPTELARIEERLQRIYSLQKKHRVDSIDALLQVEKTYAESLLKIGSLSEEILKTENELKMVFAQLSEKAFLLSQSRQKAIEFIEKSIKNLLEQVALPHAVFKIKQDVFDVANAKQQGIDDIEFLFSANAGSPLLPVNKAASGGELSRLMLCIKSLISQNMHLPTVIFDEIDTGISGDTAQKVAKVMQQHAVKHQVIAITHLPQIAAKSQNHLYVYKINTNQTTLTAIKQLNKEEKIEEIARMLSGNNPSDTVIMAAKELVES